MERHQVSSDVVDSLVDGESPELGVVRTGSVGSGPFDLEEEKLVTAPEMENFTKDKLVSPGIEVCSNRHLLVWF